MSQLSPDIANDILHFWFGQQPYDLAALQTRWWQKDTGFDASIRARFHTPLTVAIDGGCADWLESPTQCLALIVLLDQFSRNIYRNTPQAFAQDRQALAATLQGIDRQFDQALDPIERLMFYMPLMHAESEATQALSLKYFSALAHDAPDHYAATLSNTLDFAQRHADIIKRFGRYPHRNAILERPSTPEETAFLQTPHSSF